MLTVLRDNYFMLQVLHPTFPTLGDVRSPTFHTSVRIPCGMTMHTWFPGFFLLYISSILCKDSKGTSLTFQISVFFKSHSDIGTIMKACRHIETLVSAVAEMFFACHPCPCPCHGPCLSLCSMLNL